jgi:hypothetical protein
MVMSRQQYYFPEYPSDIRPAPRRSPSTSEFDLVREECRQAFQKVWDDGGGSSGSQVLALPEEYDHNPVLNPTQDRAYYPSLLYFPAGFAVGGTPYKYLCVHALDTNAGGGLLLSGSQDFKTWTQLNGGNPLVGVPTAAHHPFVAQTGVGSFRLYYWDSAVSIYQVSAIRTAVSTDLVNWTGDQPLQNGATPIVTGLGVGWNRGSYGPCHVFYNSTASNAGSNPFDYSYAMFFDATTGAFESIGLGYSADGVTFTLYGEVLPAGSDTWGNPVPWDSSYATFGQIFQTPLGKWLMFYSGGKNASSEGIGVAISDDRLSWTRLTVNGPLLGKVAGTWRSNRCYAVATLVDFTNRFSGDGDTCDVKLLVSGQDAGGDYTCGYFKIPYMYANVQEALYRLGRL